MVAFGPNVRYTLAFHPSIYGGPAAYKIPAVCCSWPRPHIPRDLSKCEFALHDFAYFGLKGWVPLLVVEEDQRIVVPFIPLLHKACNGGNCPLYINVPGKNHGGSIFPRFIDVGWRRILTVNCIAVRERIPRLQ